MSLTITSIMSAYSMNENNEAFDRERERMHRQMLSSVSHDLKTPLASIIGSLEVYERMKTKLAVDKQETLIRVALQEAYRLDNFITNILDMAKLENGMVKVKHEITEVSAMLRNCLLRLSGRLENCNVTFESAGDLEVTTDPVLLSRAICLIIDNAVKYGGVRPEIYFSYGKLENGLGFIGVRDNGGGIPAAQMKDIFSKYTRFAKEDQQNAGTGLGLSIAREVTRLLGGDIEVANYNSGGAIFTMTFSA